MLKQQEKNCIDITFVVLGGFTAIIMLFVGALLTIVRGTQCPEGHVEIKHIGGYCMNETVYTQNLVTGETTWPEYETGKQLIIAACVLLVFAIWRSKVLRLL